MFAHVIDVPTMWFIFGISIFVFAGFTYMSFFSKPESFNVKEIIGSYRLGETPNPYDPKHVSNAVIATAFDPIETPFSFSGKGLVEIVSDSGWRIVTNGKGVIRTGETMQCVEYDVGVYDYYYHGSLVLTVPVGYALEADGNYQYCFPIAGQNPNFYKWSHTPYVASNDLTMRLLIRIPLPFSTGASEIKLRKVTVGEPTMRYNMFNIS